MMFDLTRSRATTVVGLTLGSVALVVLYAIVQLWMTRQGYVEEIDRLAPRTARLQGMIQKEAELAGAAGEVRGILADIAYPPGRDSAMVAAAMQQRIRDTFTAEGMSVSGSQILPVRQLSGFEHLPLDITAVGSIASLEQALGELRELRPVVLVESATMKPVRARRMLGAARSAPQASGDQRQLSVRLRVLSLRLL